VKTHKTTELTRLQVGEDCKNVRLVVSTLVEAAQLVQMLLGYKSRWASVNVLYGVPLGPSQSERLGAVGRILGSGSISATIDDVGQLAGLKPAQKIAGFPPAVFAKIDTGYHRAGCESGSGTLKTLLAEIQGGEHAGILAFKGYYSHASDSYGNNTSEKAMCRLVVQR
jgi:D-serine ammonia-lyase